MRSLLSCTLAISTVAATAQDLAQQLPVAEIDKIFHEGELASRKGNYDKAIALFTQVIERDPQHINALLQRGYSQSMSRHYELAVADLTAVIKLKDDHLWAYTSRGNAYKRLGRQTEAMATSTRCSPWTPRTKKPTTTVVGPKRPKAI